MSSYIRTYVCMNMGTLVCMHFMPPPPNDKPIELQKTPTKHEENYEKLI